MSDLAHVYTSDIKYGETFCFAAGTQFNAQRLGQNTNYLLDVYGPILTALAGFSSAGKFVTFDASGTYSGANTIYSGSTQLLGGILFVSPLQNGEPIGQVPTGGLGGGPAPVYGAPVPFALWQDYSPNKRSYLFNTGSGAIKVAAGIISNPTFTDVMLYASGSIALTVKGIMGYD